MNKLDDREWKEFDFCKIFEIKKGFYNKKPPCPKDGNIPFIGASDSNNGFTGFTTFPLIEANSKIGYGKNEPIEKKIFSGNAICVTNNGSVGYAYYQKHRFTCTHDVNPLYLKHHKLNRHIAMFLICCIEQQRVCFAYARQWRPKRMVKSKLKLPVKSGGAPDWDFMEAYMRQKEQQLLKPTIERLCKRLIEKELINVNGGGNSLHSNWKEFVFGEEFSIKATQSGIDKNKLTNIQGNYPYITRTDTTNGMDMFVGNQSERYCMDNGNVITIGLDTQTVFYQPTSFYTGQNIQIIRHNKLDKYNALFLIVAIKKLVAKFSWGSYGATLTRLKKSRLYLPATESGEIDFEFMSSFMKKIEEDILSTTLQVFEKRTSVNKSKSGGG